MPSQPRFSWTTGTWKRWTEGSDRIAKQQLSETTSLAVAAATPGAPYLILDAGCGYGRISEILLRTYPECRIAAVDNSTDMLKSVSRLGSEGALMPVLGSLERLPFRSGVFRVVVCYGVIMHALDDASALEELVRVLAPSGKILLTYNNVLNPMWLPFSIYARVAKPKGYVHRFRPIRFIQSICEMAGCRVRTIHPGFVIPGGSWPDTTSGIISNLNRKLGNAARSIGFEPLLEISR